MSVQRNAQGQISAVSSVAAAKAAGRDDPVESLIMVECDRIVSAADQQVLAKELLAVLADVRAAVTDWSAMLERVQQVSSACEKHAPAQTANEGVAFLRWLEDRHFTFLGARDYELRKDGDKVTLVAIPESGLGILRGKVQTQSGLSATGSAGHHGIR